MPHTPGPCSCTVKFQDKISRFHSIVYCLTHAQAPAMLAVIRRYVAGLDRGTAKLSAYAQAHAEAARKRNPQRFKLSDDARAILRAVEDV